MVTEILVKPFDILADMPWIMPAITLCLEPSILECIIFEIKATISFFTSDEANFAVNYDQWREFYKISQIMDSYYYNDNIGIRRAVLHLKIQPRNLEIFNEINPFFDYYSELEFYESMSEEKFYRTMYDENNSCWTSTAVALALKVNNLVDVCKIIAEQLKKDVRLDKTLRSRTFVIIRNKRINKSRLIWLDYQIYNEYRLINLFLNNRYLKNVCNENLFNQEKIIEMVAQQKAIHFDKYFINTGNLTGLFRK